MSPTSVLILDDDDALRDVLRLGLASSGFAVASAATAQEATQRTSELKGTLDVALIDVELSSGKNGFEAALDIRQSQPDWPPEFLVLSGRDRPEYYQSAFALGAAGYLRKGEYMADPLRPESARGLQIEDVTDHVRMLSLRRALQGARPGMADRLRRIAEASHSHEDAAQRFCQDLLRVELEAALAGQFVLLLMASGHTTCFPGSRFELSDAANFDWLEQLVHLRLGDPNPLLIEKTQATTWLPKLPPKEQLGAELTFQQLHGVAFVPLGETKTTRLALGVGPDGSSSAMTRARLVDRYLRQSIIPHLLEITEMWAELDARRRILVRATSEFCLYQGQELEELLDEAEAEASSEVQLEPKHQTAFPTARLYAVAEELRDAGEVLAHLHRADGQETPAPGVRLEMPALVDAVVKENPQRFEALGIHVAVDGDGAAFGRRDRISEAVFQILSWLARRAVKVRGENKPMILVHCEPGTESGRTRIVFTEAASRRLISELRESLFAPFFSRPYTEPTPAAAEVKDKGRRLGLFLARSLAEAEGGAILDISEELPGDRGHRFLLELPAA